MSINIPIHSTIEQIQSSHGVRHDDFKQYREYCTRRLSRLRHNKSVRRDLVNSSAYVSGEKTKRHAFCARDIPDEGVEHENFLLVVLIDAERAWAHSNELKALLHEQLPKNHQKAKSSAGKVRQHALRRLRRANSLATNFLELCEKFADEVTKEEAKAYAAWMNGNLALENNNWKVACDEYQNAMSLCTKLSQQENDLEISDLFAGRANSVLKPLLKYCQYELKESGGDVEIMEGNKSEEGARKSAVSSLTYRDQTVEIESKDLKVLLLKAETLKADSTSSSSSEGDDEAFVSLLSMYDEAQTIVTTDLQKYREMKAGPAVNAKRDQLENLSGYIKLQKLQLSMEHQEKIIASIASSDKKIADSAHLYDALLQDARAVCDLPGPEEEDEFYLEASANVLRVRAFRSFYIAQLYASLGKFPEATVLIQQSEHLANQANEEIAACDEMKEADAYMDSLDELLHEIKTIKLRFQVQSFLGTSTLSSKGDMFSQLNQFKPSNNIVDISPIPAPAKPAFFDIAWNYASTFPQQELEEYIENNKPKGSSGLMSWFRGS